MLKQFRGSAIAALAALLLLAAPVADAASVPALTGPAGANPAQNPTNLGDYNAIIGAVNANIAPPIAGLTPPAANSTHVATNAVPPALTSCGTTPAIAGSDTAGIVTMGTSATGCVITFATAYTVAPFCVVTWIATPLASQSYVTSATAITTTQTSTSNNKLQYVCVAQSGG